MMKWLIVPVMIVHWVPAAIADEYIGALSNAHGQPPPVVRSGEFFAPTLEIRLSGPGAPRVFGYDYPHPDDCIDQEYHIAGSCSINGESIAWVNHYYRLGGTGNCVEVFDWDERIVTLGSPGWFSIEVEVHNTLGPDIGNVCIYGWEIWTVGDPPPEYEIVLCEPDRTLYTSGQGSATFSIVIRSNWGESEHLSAGLELRSTMGEIYELVSPVFSLGIGDEYSTDLTWEVPAVSEPVAYGFVVTLHDDFPPSAQGENEQ